MKRSSAQIICAVVLFSAAAGTLAEKPSKKSLKKVTSKQGSPAGPFIPPLNLPPIPPYRLSPVGKSPPPVDPYACLPKYLCVVKNKKGEKRTTIVHGLHPALRKAKPNVIDPATLPQVPGGGKPFNPPYLPEGSVDDELFRDREFDDSFLSEQEKAEAMAFLEEKRRQFMYQQGLPKQKIIPKGGEKTEEDDDKKSKESNEEEEEKSQEGVSKEDKEEETEKSAEMSKEEESVEEDGSTEADDKSRAKLSKYKIKKKLYNKQRTNPDPMLIAPWDNRIKNDSDPLKPSEIYDKLFGKVLPAFQLSSLPNIARSIPGVKALLGSAEEVSTTTTTTTTTTQRPGLLTRMLTAVTGNSGANMPPPQQLKKRNGMPIRRFRRDAAENLKLIADDENAKIIKEIKDPARQCRMIYKGCDLPYEHIMKMVSNGQVLIESDNEAGEEKLLRPANPAVVAQDDEAEQLLKDTLIKPIPDILGQASRLSTFGKNKKKTTSPSGEDGNLHKKSAYGKKKPHDIDASSSEEDEEYIPRLKPKKAIASLPLKPMRYQWGKPTYTVNGKATHNVGPPDYSGGLLDPVVYTTQSPLPTTTTTTTPRPIFASLPLDKKANGSVPVLQQSVIRLNKTHSVHVYSPKKYNPPKTKTFDAKGRPLSFSQVFTEIAGQNGGIHDFFDRISGAFGGDGTKESGRELKSPFPETKLDIHGRPIAPPSPMAKPTAFPSKPIPPDHIEKDEEGSSERQNDDEMDDEESEEEEEEEDDQGNNEEVQEHREESHENNDDDEESEEEEEDIGDDISDLGPHQLGPKQVAPQPMRPSPAPINPEIASQLALQQQIYQLGEKNKPVQQKQPGINKPAEPDEEEEESEEDEEEDINISGLPKPVPGKEKTKKNKKPLVLSPEKPVEDEQPAPGKPKPSTQEQQQEEEAEDDLDEEEDAEDDDEYDLPDSIPPFIKQSMIEQIKKKKQEEAEGGQRDEEENDEEGGQPGPGPPQHGRPQQPHGRPGPQGPGQGPPPKRPGGFLSSFFS